MKTKRLLAIVGSMGLLAAGSVFAGDHSHPKAPVGKAPIPDPPCFEAGETIFEAISIYALPSGGGDPLDEGFGGGIGLSHYYTENFGVQTRAYWWDGDSAIHSITASLVYRCPIQDLCLAPFIYGGGGGHFDSTNQGSGHLGTGIEYRVKPGFGIVADYRYTWTSETEDWHLFTLGARFVF